MKKENFIRLVEIAAVATVCEELTRSFVEAGEKLGALVIVLIGCVIVLPLILGILDNSGNNHLY